MVKNFDMFFEEMPEVVISRLPLPPSRVALSHFGCLARSGVQNKAYFTAATERVHFTLRNALTDESRTGAND